MAYFKRRGGKADDRGTDHSSKPLSLLTFIPLESSWASCFLFKSGFLIDTTSSCQWQQLYYRWMNFTGHLLQLVTRTWLLLFPDITKRRQDNTDPYRNLQVGMFTKTTEGHRAGPWPPGLTRSFTGKSYPAAGTIKKRHQQVLQLTSQRSYQWHCSEDQKQQPYHKQTHYHYKHGPHSEVWDITASLCSKRISFALVYHHLQ